MAPGASLTKQSMILVSGRLIAFAVSMILPIILVRMLTREEYGLYREIFLIHITLMPIVQQGIEQGLFYFIPREPAKKRQIILHTLIFVLVIGTVVLLALLVFREGIGRLFNVPAMLSFVPVLAIHLCLSIYSSFLESCMIAEGRATYASLFTVGIQITTSAIILCAVFYDASVLTLMYANIGGSLVRLAFQLYYMKISVGISMTDFEMPLFIAQLKYSAPLSVANIAWTLQTRIHNFFISYMYDAQTFATYSIGVYQIPVFALIAGTVANVMTPELVRLRANNDAVSMKRVWNNAIRKMNLVILPSCVYLFTVSYEFIIILFTREYVESVPIFQLSLVNFLIAGVNTGAVLQAYSQTRFLMCLGVLRLPVTIAMILPLIHLFGPGGAVVANIISNMMFRYVELVRASRCLSIRVADSIAWRVNSMILIISIVSAFPVIILKVYAGWSSFVVLLVSGPVYFVLYSFIIIKAKVVAQHEVDAFKNYIGSKLRRAPA
jgi:O-antigen/teichoic acid export membrane protein